MATRSRTAPVPASDLPEQLALLPASEVPLQFRLDQRTRLRGLEHIARIRQQLEAQAARRSTESRPTPRRSAPSVHRAA